MGGENYSVGETEARKKARKTSTTIETSVHCWQFHCINESELVGVYIFIYLHAVSGCTDDVMHACIHETSHLFIQVIEKNVRTIEERERE